MNEAGPYHIKHLDGLRGVAILLVLSRHFTSGTSLNNYFLLGWTGVDLFFVLSGFLITGILLDTKNKKGYYRIFIFRRMLRIFPLYYGVLVVCFFLYPHLSIISWFRDYQIYFWTYTQNHLFVQKGLFTTPLGHFWSLAIEEQFYLVWPLLVFILKPKQILGAISFLIVVGIALRTYHPETPFATVFTLTRMDGLLTGSGIAVLMRINKEELLKKASYIFVIFSATFLLLLIALKPWNGWSGNFIQIGYPLLAFFFGSLLIFSFTNNWVKNILSLKLLTWFGKYSYGIYIFNSIIINVTWYYFPSMVQQHTKTVYAGMLLATLVISFLSYHLFEKHFLKMKPSFAQQKSGAWQYSQKL